ncbi:3-oxoacyl-ACP reductase [Salipiger aestuarii]|uniref:3-oxoacyl-[acyl-carrier protein] reductase n=1 Tax=Salipiger aestuarii TaxID=568098 RepID=A0A327YHB7_9RHOB|nr:SDR family oxidoreductase [Salipiger aestuarii]EIE51464.1 putative short-chain dehydrogenase/oxidoreductase [Citreicella sp. 357]KAA8608916.1 3-oxoacyl-ACP reductase [Salipiger aestuarii]KAA8613221.1 3-oxoacyl-ACP reductase [Salipiger aestuarii]KAB2543027.1 3-oxoacyl-ACP reductase [Salipiger aestuarii]RAK19712.1 3-oxoacyl-[acyl-carrier protein] reductase [Salipiger aestuarii]
MDLGLTDRRALVLASSRGLGRGIAEALAAEGARVMLTGRDAATLEAVAAQINARGAGQADWMQVDLTAPDFAARTAEHVRDRFGGVDILVNNTGGPKPGAARDIDVAVLMAQAQAMVASVIDLTGRLIPGMCAQGWGRVLTVASSGVEQPIPNLALSNTLRGALAGWNKTLATEVAGEGVTCNMLLPGRIHTDRLDQLDGAVAETQGKPLDEVRAASRRAIPAKRYGRVDEFGAVGAFLCSEPAGYVTGSMVRCDGGMISSV